MTLTSGSAGTDCHVIVCRTGAAENMLNSSHNILVNGDRLWSDLMELADITVPDRPYTRRSFSPEFDRGRDWLTGKFKAAGATTHIDAAGNLIGRVEGSDPSAGTILIGSHSDTVPDGGRFDGAAGVIVALEVMRSLKEHGIVLRHALECVDFLAEEASEFGLSCIGSRGMAGKLPDNLVNYTRPDGENLKEALTRVGGTPETIELAIRDDIAASFELHIEQGRVLESAGLDIGIVTAIVGITRLEIQFSGRADHAGTTPMLARSDAFSAAAEFSVWLNRRAKALSSLQESGYFVATVGEAQISPGAANVVPGAARLVLDLRAENDALMADFLAELETMLTQCASEANVTAQLRILSQNKASHCDPELMAILDESCQARGYRHTKIASGAGHDTAFMTQITSAAMVFVPCRDGRSHTPEEWCEPSQLQAGANTLLEAVIRFGRSRS